MAPSIWMVGSESHSPPELKNGLLGMDKYSLVYLQYNNGQAQAHTTSGDRYKN